MMLNKKSETVVIKLYMATVSLIYFRANTAPASANHFTLYSTLTALLNDTLNVRFIC